MIKPNDDLRKLCRERKIPLWMVAEKLGYSDQTLYRNLRHPLGDKERKEVLEAIEKLTSELKKMA